MKIRTCPHCKGEITIERGAEMKFENLPKSRIIQAITEYFRYREAQSWAIAGETVGDPLSADAKLFDEFIMKIRNERPPK